MRYNIRYIRQNTPLLYDIDKINQKENVIKHLYQAKSSREISLELFDAFRRD